MTVEPAVVEGLRIGLSQLQRVQRVPPSIEAHVTENDHEWRASVLRTRTLVVLGQLQLLEHAARDEDAALVEPVGELRRYLVARIARIHRALRRHADDITSSGGSATARHMLHGVALSKAEYGFTALAADPFVSSVLDVGGRSSPLFETACRALVLALGGEMVAEASQ